MTPEISRALALVKGRLNLGLTATDDLIAEWGNAASAQDLPAWIRIMAASQATPSPIRSSAPGEPLHVNGPDAEGAMEDVAEAKARRSRQMALLETRALGHDTTPGGEVFHRYWTVGKGRREWVDSPKPWTTLVALLTRHVGPEKAKIYASRWFIEVKGYAAGSDLNRVAHGHKPRGHRIGPG